MMSNILVNFSKANVGGGKSILINFLEHSHKLNEHKYFIITPDYNKYKSFTKNNIYILDIKKIYLKNTFFIFFYCYYIQKLIKRNEIDLIFNFGDVIIPTKRKQVYYFDWAYAVYGENYLWERMSVKDVLLRKTKIFLIGRYIKKLSLVIVQSQNINDRIRKKYNINKLITMPTPVNFTGNNVKFADKEKYNVDKLKIFYPASFFSHKNFEIIISLANDIKRLNKGHIIYLTLNKESSEDFFLKIKELKLNNQIKNLGRLNLEEIQKVYRESDIVVIPSLLESFGLTYYESMYYRKPVVASNLDFAKVACKNAALYFDPFNSIDILDKIEVTFKDDMLNLRLDRGEEIVKELPKWEETMMLFEKEINSVLR
ncbi:glycosyltransferase [Tenacibaculum sp. S7007]|uniref:Glycosyltransferase n=1 Tax=Tenacibaculum pelagium TaxID=2759527 RepID=A0A839AQ72_9FLAO|nr:glycosyltransferase [Tenacibaculum pelagium]MBA6156294.1 glycosyltransferase [Tenacibaculum pelagium]